jgi:hypothetical protein
LTMPSTSGIVGSYKSIIYAVDQVDPMGKGASWMTTIVEYTEGHYEVHKTSYGDDYVWCPVCVVVECDCGERPVLSASETVCSCGADHVDLVREELASRKASDGISHPWDVEYDEWQSKQDEYLLSEEIYWLELSRID